MELIQPLTTSVIRFVKVQPNEIFVPDLIRGAQERYRFWQVPQSLEEYSRAEGAEFKVGTLGGSVIDVVRLFSNGILIEGKLHSNRLDDFADDIIQWAHKEFGLEYVDLSPVARTYTSTVEIRSNFPLGPYMGALNSVADRLTSMMSAYGYSIAPYEFTTVTAITDPTLSKPLNPGRFLFDRRAGQTFDSGVFFSEAPVSTDEHMELLNLFERMVMAV